MALEPGGAGSASSPSSAIDAKPYRASSSRTKEGSTACEKASLPRRFAISDGSSPHRTINGMAEFALRLAAD